MPRRVQERHQHLERSQIELKDDHGRTWLVESEVGLDASRRPRITPVGQFHPAFIVPYDFLPPAKYLVYDPNKPGLLRISYRAWESDVQVAHREIKSELMRLATKLYKSEAAQFVAAPTDQMIEMIYGRGKGPEPVEPITACRQGNGWILGLRHFDEKLAGDQKLKEYLEMWVQVRYHEVPDGDGTVDDVIDFTEGQRKPRPVLV